MKNKIYIISVFEKMEKVQSELGPTVDIGCKVINGWYFEKEDAENIIVNNVTDIWETCYDYAVLEECKEGMYDFDRNRTYYKYNRETNQYEVLNDDDIPNDFLNPAFSISGIGM